jgi:hypothetical protein
MNWPGLFITIVLVAWQQRDVERPPQFKNLPDEIWERIKPEYQANEKAKAHSRGYWMKPGKAYPNLQIPPPVTTVQLRRYASFLNLSEAQFSAFQSLYEQYLVDDWSNRENTLQPFMDRASEYSTVRGSHLINQDLADEYTEIVKDRSEILKVIAAREERLFADLIPLLTEAQAARMDEVRSARRCDRLYIPPRWPGSPGLKVDFTIAFQAMQESGVEILPLDPNQFDHDIAQYLALLADRLEQATNASFQCTIESNPIMIEAQEFANATIAQRRAGETVDEAEFVAQYSVIRDRLKPIVARRVQASRRVYDLNVQYLERFTAQLPIETAEELTDWFRMLAYPVVYPNPFNAGPVFEAALALVDITSEQTAILDAVEMNYLDRRDALSQAMVDKYIKWYYETEMRLGHPDSPYHAYQENMSRLQEQRRKSAEEALHVLESTLTPEQFTLLRPALEKYHQLGAAFEKLKKNMPYPERGWPGPFD